MSHVKTLSITLGDGPGALQRVVTVCARRRLEVVSLTFQRAGARVDLCVEGNPRQLAGARAWLSALVDVLAVREIAVAPAVPSRGREPRPDRPGCRAATP
jgi:acetolactate synthase small subunit